MTVLTRDILSISDLSKNEILEILDETRIMKENKRQEFLAGRILGSCFFEPSTRTRLSFESAMIRLGGAVVGFSDGKGTSMDKGETLIDTMKMLESYVDVIVLRHPLEGAARLAADAVDIPVINAGDGAHQHPSQTLTDLYTIAESQGTLENLRIGLAGDLKNGRTVHSLCEALVHFNARLYLLSSNALEIPPSSCEMLRERGIKFSFHSSFEEVIDKLDVLYMTRTQKERGSQESPLTLHLDHLENVKENFRILHPLPRCHEMDMSIDQTKHAHYFKQAENGLYTRQALLRRVL